MRLALLLFPASSHKLQLLAVFCAAIAGVQSVHADLLTVTTTADGGMGSLRDAIAAASDGDTIQFDAALSGNTITLTSGELVIDKNVTIRGPGEPNLLTIWTGLIPLSFRIFHIMPARSVLIEGLTIYGGHPDTSGGGILNDQATLTLNSCTVERNFSGASGGGISNEGASAMLTIVNSNVTTNSSSRTGGGLAGGIANSGTMVVSNSYVGGNTVNDFPALHTGSAGGIYNSGMMEISNSTISGNSAALAGGGIINSGTMTITASIVRSNSLIRPGYGGGIDNGGSLTITNSTISGNSAIFQASSFGGGIYNSGPLTITNSTFSDNTSDNGHGGGIYHSQSTLDIGNTILKTGSSGANLNVNGSGAITVTSHGYNLTSDDGAGFFTASGDQINTDPMLGPLQDNGGLTFTHALLTGSPAINAGDPTFTPPPLYDQRGPGYDRVFNGRVDIGSFEAQPAPPTPTPPPVTPTPTIGPSPTATVAPTPSPIATPTPTIGPPTAAQALNISTRLRVETGDRIAIGGFIVTGTESKRIAIRGVGPSLGNSGLSDFLADPILELRGSDGALLLQNDNWQDDPAQAAQLMALGLAPQNPNESGIVATLEPGVYTAILAGKNQTSGLALVEIYDADTAADSRLANISTRGFVRTGDNVMIGGFILGEGSASVDVAVRGIGPSLGQSGLTDVLADPTLELHDGNGALLIANDNWQDDAVSAAQLAGHGLAPANSLESGIFTTLPPGLFTAILAGKDGGVGLGLVEIYSGLDGNTLTVTSTADSGPGSLRDAIAAAGDGGTIQFDPALNGQTISLTSGELLIDKSITIRGPAIVERSAADGTPAFRIFHITPSHTVMMHGLTIRNGFADMNNPSGGGVFNDQSTLTLSYGAVEYNRSAVGSGGGIYNSGSSAILTVAHSTVTGNFMEVAGGFSSGSISRSSVRFEHLPTGGGFGAGIYSDGTLAIDHSTVSNNGIGLTIIFNFSGDGAGIYSSGGAVISNSSVSGNHANRVAGGIFNRGTLEITNTTINFNWALYGGGGVFNEGTLAIDNSTFTGNTAANLLAQGGGISNEGATTTITRTTFSENSADGDGGNIFNSGAIQIGNTILKAQSGGGNIFSEGGASTVTSLGYNLSSDNGGGFLTATGDQINTAPILGPLQDNGGLTFTHQLLTGSPAINAGDPSFTPPPLYDQRGPGYDRVVGGRIDIGSFEVQP